MTSSRYRLPLLLALIATAAAAYAEVKSAASDGFLVSYTKRLDAPPANVYAALATIERWWDGDHTYSGSAANLSLQPQAGGCFCERWGDGSVEHGRVIMALRDQTLRLQAALGPLQGRAVTGVLTFQLKPDEKGTQLTMTYLVSGTSASALDKSAPAVDGVLGTQFSRLTRLIETGKAAAQ
jgi:uncharacterized protein YndB with AHSA1/START domain